MQTKEEKERTEENIRYQLRLARRYIIYIFAVTAGTVLLFLLIRLLGIAK